MGSKQQRNGSVVEVSGSVLEASSPQSVRSSRFYYGIGASTALWPFLLRFASFCPKFRIVVDSPFSGMGGLRKQLLTSISVRHRDFSILKSDIEHGLAASLNITFPGRYMQMSTLLKSIIEP